MKFLKRDRLILMTAIILLVGNSACEEKTEIQMLSGQLVGYVQLLDNHGSLISDNSNVEITVEGSNPEITVYSDEDGQYVIDDLESGSYNFTFNKDGFSQYKIFGRQFVGGNQSATLGTQYLVQVIDCQIQNVQISTFDKPSYPKVNITAEAIYSNEDLYPACRYYLSSDPDVSYKNYNSTYAQRLFYESGEFSFSLFVDTIQYPVGSELYLIMYPSIGVYGDFYSYTDFEFGNTIYTTVNINQPSNVAHIRVPNF